MNANLNHILNINFIAINRINLDYLLIRKNINTYSKILYSFRMKWMAWENNNTGIKQIIFLFINKSTSLKFFTAPGKFTYEIFVYFLFKIYLLHAWQFWKIDLIFFLFPIKPMAWHYNLSKYFCKSDSAEEVMRWYKTYMCCIVLLELKKFHNLFT